MAAILFIWWWRSRTPLQDEPLQTAIAAIVADYRKIIVLMDGADALDPATRARCAATGQALFYRKQRSLQDMAASLSQSSSQPARIDALVRYLSDDRSLHDADRLAFLDLVDELADSNSPSAPRLRALLDNLQSIQLAYREEVTRIFSQFATRGPTGGREKWDAYVSGIRKLYTREQVLTEFPVAVLEEPPSATRGVSKEVWGTEFPAKTVALTFDDGPHFKYTEQVLAILSKYGLKAAFFEVGYPIGTVDPSGAVKFLKGADITRKVMEAGHVLANHSYSHPVLAKLPEADRNTEIDRTNLLLEKISGHKTELFRAPYGARNAAIVDRVISQGMHSIMWNINAEDWSDPIPESIAMRVLHQMNQQHKGIIVLHDIHKQSVMALSTIIEELQRQEYSFLVYDKGQFVKFERPSVKERATESATAGPPPADSSRKFYRDSWAVIVGINDYQKWPKLRYAVNDANGIEEALVSRFGFQRDHIRKLTNGEATRQRIMEVLGDEFTDNKRIQREDRVFFFFAGHGATRNLDDGRQIGFIVPVDADKSSYYSTAISMTALREAADLIPAKHVYFVMDSCYSGLAMTRGSSAFSRDRSYLQEVTRRTARQILTAGGAEQQVADDGPNGHSVFTWALLQGLEGPADLDGNGVITASELGAYIGPIVSSFARQTPAIGNMVGSEGGEFIFELQPQPLSAEGKPNPRAAELSEQLSSIQKQIAAKQEELLKLQQSIQAQSQKLAQGGTRSSSEAAVPAAPVSAPVRAYDLERQGLALLREKKNEEALKKFQAAVQLKPGDALLLNNLGYMYFAIGRYDEALSYLQKTLAIDPRRKEAHQNIADTYLKLNRRAEAKKHYEEFLALYPASARLDEIRKTLETLN